MVDIRCCKNCEDRYLGCHDKYEKYQSAKKEREKMKEKERIESKIYNDYWQTTIVGRRRNRG